MSYYRVQTLGERYLSYTISGVFLLALGLVLVPLFGWGIYQAWAIGIGIGTVSWPLYFYFTYDRPIIKHRKELLEKTRD